jgi:hypothetical protein
MGAGRTTDYTQEIADEICKHLADGKTLREVCRMDGMPAESTVRNWALTNRNEFGVQYSRAREIGYYSMADETLEISDDGSNDWMKSNSDDGSAYHLNGEHVQRSRLRVDTRKWLLSKALPKIYGDKLQHTGADGEGPVKVEQIGEFDLARRIALALAGKHDKPAK